MGKGKLGKATFCPWCGTPTLTRDTFNSDTQRSDTHVSYTCSSCCTGFSLRDSPRVMFVNRMYAEVRKQRPPDNEHHPRSGQLPLSERSDFEINRIHELLLAKRPRTKAGKEANAIQMNNVKLELKRRKHALTYTIGEKFPELKG